MIVYQLVSKSDPDYTRGLYVSDADARGAMGTEYAHLWDVVSVDKDVVFVFQEYDDDLGHLPTAVYRTLAGAENAMKEWKVRHPARWEVDPEIVIWELHD